MLLGTLLARGFPTTAIEAPPPPPVPVLAAIPAPATPADDGSAELPPGDTAVVALEVATEEEEVEGEPQPQERRWGVPLVVVVMVVLLGLLPRSCGSSRHVFSPSFTTLVCLDGLDQYRGDEWYVFDERKSPQRRSCP